MVTVHFRGRIYPSGIYVNVPRASSPVRGQVENVDIQAVLFIAVENSQIDVECQTDRFDAANPSWHYTQIYQYTRAIVDCLAFMHGVGFILIIDEFVTMDGTCSSTGPIYPKLEAINTAFDSSQPLTSFGNACLINLISREPSLLFAVNDLVQALSVPNLAEINCARAIEGYERSCFQMIRAEKTDGRKCATVFD